MNPRKNSWKLHFIVVLLLRIDGCAKPLSDSLPCTKRGKAPEFWCYFPLLLKSFVPKLLLTNAFVFPVPFEVHPLVVSAFPSSRNPNRVRTRRTPPMPPYPKILVSPRMPAVIAGNPNDMAAGSYHDFFSWRRWRTDLDIQPDMELSRSRYGYCQHTDKK